MQINNQIDTSGGGNGLYLDSRDIKDKAMEGIKVRLYGDAQMGHSYFQLKEDGKKTVVRSEAFPEMVNPTEGFNPGEVQKPSACFYVAAWNYETEAPCLLTLDKVALINGVIAVNDDPDLKDATEYDFKMTYDEKASPQDKYKVIRLDASPLTADQKKELKAFAEDLDLEAYAAGEDLPF